MNRKMIILIVLAAVFVISLVYRFTHPYKQERVAQLTYTGEETKRAKKNTTGAKRTDKQEMQLVRLDFVSDPPRHSGKVHANIFFRRKLSQKNIYPEEGIVSEPAATAAGVEDPAAMIKRRLSNLKFLGSHTSNGESIFFLEKGKSILLVRKGDRVEGQYLIEMINEQSLTLRSDQAAEPILIHFIDS